MISFTKILSKINHSPLNEVARISAYFEIVVCERLEVQYQTCKRKKTSVFAANFVDATWIMYQFCMRNCNAININFVSRGRNCKLYSVETFCKSRRTLKTLETPPLPKGLSLSHTHTETETKELSEWKTFSPIECPSPTTTKKIPPFFCHKCEQ